jgi:hypothetical protein
LSKFVSPLLGYNNNVRHKGKVFHIQTEDSGAKYGHIITHLFMDGGRILKSVKTSYSEYIGSDRMAEIVREMMKQQHKAMFIALRDGKFDAVAEGSTDALPLVAEAPAAQQTAPDVRGAGEALKVPGAANVAVTLPPGFGDAPDGPATIRTQMPEELMLDIDALERAAAAAAAGDSPLLRGASDLPPPPANLFRERKATGKYKVTPPPSAAVEPAGKPGAPAGLGAKPSSAHMPAAGPVRRASQGSMAAAGDRRYAPTRPASIFGQAKPTQGKTVFGEDLISDKSLDEVILSYLAEDLDEKK